MTASIRTFLGVMSLWSAAQVVFLAMALSKAPPSPTAELIGTGLYPALTNFYVSFLVFHSFAILVFGVGAFALPAYYRISDKITPLRRSGVISPLHGVSKATLGRNIGRIGLTIILLFWAGLPVAVLFVSILTLAAAGQSYLTFIDIPNEAIFVRETHFMPPGIRKREISFSEVQTIEVHLRASGGGGIIGAPAGSQKSITQCTR